MFSHWTLLKRMTLEVGTRSREPVVAVPLPPPMPPPAVPDPVPMPVAVPVRPPVPPPGPPNEPVQAAVASDKSGTKHEQQRHCIDRDREKPDSRGFIVVLQTRWIRAVLATIADDAFRCSRKWPRRGVPIKEIA